MVFNEGFTDLGFLDVAVNEVKHYAEIDSTFIGKSSIAPFVHIEYQEGFPNISFTCDSVFIYDDLRGHLDTTYLATDVSYVTSEEQLVLQLPAIQ